MRGLYFTLRLEELVDLDEALADRIDLVSAYHSRFAELLNDLSRTIRCIECCYWPLQIQHSLKNIQNQLAIRAFVLFCFHSSFDRSFGPGDGLLSIPGVKDVRSR